MTAPTAPARPRPSPRSPSVLDEIAAQRRLDIERDLAGTSTVQLRRDAAAAPPPRDGVRPLLRPGLHLIAEIKRRSPSAGDLPGGSLDIAQRARAYQAGGASIISVLVEPHRFGGSPADLRSARAATSLPILAKDFVVDGRQLPLLRAAGADLVLLLARLHPARRLARLVQQALDLGLEPLVEAHDRRETEAAVATGARLIGINNRDLRTLRVDPGLAERLRDLVPDDRLVVAESGVTDPDLLRTWRALGFDAALVGEALMRSESSAEDIRARTAAFVAAGRVPGPGQDPSGEAREASVKICGITESAGLRRALAAGVDAIGFNFVPGTRRALAEAEAEALIADARGATHAGAGPRLVGIFADRDPRELAAIATRLGLDEVQLHGNEPPEALDAIPLPVRKVLQLPAQSGAQNGTESTVQAVLDKAAPYRARPNLAGFLLDTADPRLTGGTGRRSATDLAAGVARSLPVILAGGLTAANVAEALREIPALGVDVASGVDAVTDGSGRGAKDPFLVALFIKRARAARLDLPALAARPEVADPGLLEPDERGRWGRERRFGGRFVPETLMAALGELDDAWRAIRLDTAFWAELRERSQRYVGRPTPLYRADRLAAAVAEASGTPAPGLRLYLKREDLAHTGAHKINNALGQALIAKRLGKPRVVAETGAGQHGVATATACALLDLECVVYMGAEDIERQRPNVQRMHALGAQVHPVTSGGATLKDAVNEALRDWVTTVATTHYVLGSAVGPHPFPALVRDLQRVIGDEAAAQMMAVEGRLPDAAVACLGGGSNGIGLFARFIGEPAVRLVGVEAGGEGLAGRHAAALAGGSEGVLHGARSYLLQDAEGQVTEAHSISAGLDYPGIGPQLAALFEARRMEVLSATDQQAVAGLRLVARTEGILPALEPAHAVAALPTLVRGDAPGGPLPSEPLILLGLSGRGDKDLAALADAQETDDG
ncbi:MAG: tryptophan synthase subunit beta [Chloroflexi bacterium]|nr:tryptophan synthase subunit beta [Chloroflexota bacterium]